MTRRLPGFTSAARRSHDRNVGGDDDEIMVMTVMMTSLLMVTMGKDDSGHQAALRGCQGDWSDVSEGGNSRVSTENVQRVSTENVQTRW